MRYICKNAWWHMPFEISALGRQRHEDLCESEVYLLYRVSARSPRATQSDLYR